MRGYFRAARAEKRLKKSKSNGSRRNYIKKNYDQWTA